MAKGEFSTMADLTSTTAGAPKDVAHLEEIAVLAGGTFTATVELQVSFDGTTWVPHPTLVGKTAPFSGAVGFRCKQIRFKCSAYTDGTVKCAYSGEDADLKGN